MTHKIHVKIGDSEFSAEGDESTVKDSYSLFLDALKTRVVHQPVPPEKQQNLSNGTDKTSLSATDLERVFSVDEAGAISLKFKPASENRDADGLLALLYGYKVLKGMNEVLSLRLKSSSVQSGLTDLKASSVLGQHAQYVRTGGSRRGSTYSLNNPGIAKAEEIIRSMLT
jgi:hypothetical protein